MAQGEQHETLAGGVLLSSGNLFETQHVSIETADRIHVFPTDVLIHVVVAGDSMRHAAILRYLDRMF